MIGVFAAVGAVAIAAVGVYGVFKMAFWVASETGRSIKATNSSMPTEPLQTQPVAEKLEVQNMVRPSDTGALFGCSLYSLGLEYAYTQEKPV